MQLHNNVIAGEEKRRFKSGAQKCDCGRKLEKFMENFCFKCILSQIKSADEMKAKSKKTELYSGP